MHIPSEIRFCEETISSISEVHDCSMRISRYNFVVVYLAFQVYINKLLVIWFYNGTVMIRVLNGYWDIRPVCRIRAFMFPLMLPMRRGRGAGELTSHNF